MKLSVTRKFEFCYGHCLPGHKGLCKNHHGHNAILEVEVGKEELPSLGSSVDFSISTTSKFAKYHGMVVDFGDIKEVVKSQIIDVLDHQYLNEVLPAAYLPPTAENMARFIFEKLSPMFNFDLLRIRIYETPNSYCEIRR